MMKIFKKIKDFFNFDLLVDLFISWIIINLLFISSNWVNNKLSPLGLLYQLIITLTLLLLYFIELKRKKGKIYLFLFSYTIIGFLTGSILAFIKYINFQHIDFVLIIVSGVIGIFTPIWGKLFFKIYQILKNYIN